MIDREINPNNVEFCFVATCCGISSDLLFKESYLKDHPIDNILAEIIPKHKFLSGIKLSVDVDPISFN